MTDFAPDPGGIFASDAHRHVLGHLPTPDAEYGWSNEALALRLHPSLSPIGGEFLPVLQNLRDEGHAEEPVVGAWRMTKQGFDALTGPIANEPPPGASVLGSAAVTSATPIPKATS